MPGRIAWTPRTDYKRSLRNLTFEWGAKKQLAIETGIAESTISNWAQLGSTALPNVEQGYFIACSLGQNLLDMIGGNVVPKLPDPIARAARLLKGLPQDQQRLAIGTIEAFARSAGISDGVSGNSTPSSSPNFQTFGNLEPRPKKPERPGDTSNTKPLRSKPTSPRSDPDDSRSVREVAPEYAPEAASDTIGPVPFAGRMAAGPPIDTERWPGEWLPIRLRRRESAQTHYLAQAVGTSMVDAGIADGALVLVRRAEAARRDEIVVVWLPGDGLTIKRYRLADGRSVLAWEDGSGRTVQLREGARDQGVFVRVVK